MISVHVNEHLYLSAKQFLDLCLIAKSQSVETDIYQYAYNANLAFSIELFLKSISAKSEEKVVIQIGNAEISKIFTKSTFHGHKLTQLFSQLDAQSAEYLCETYKFHKQKLWFYTLTEVLELLDNAFIDSRYSYEKAAIYSGNDPELLLSTALFLCDVLQTKS